MSALQIHIDQDTGVPRYRQVAEDIRRRIVTGVLPPGSRLPSTRALARQLGVHRNTIVAAYRLLELEGQVRSTVGAGTFVTGEEDARTALDSGALSGRSATPGEPSGPPGPVPPAGFGGGPAPARFSWQGQLRLPGSRDADPNGWMRAAEGAGADHPILLNGAVPDSRLFPMDEFSACLQEVLGQADPQLLEYGPTEGHGPLRAWISDWMARSGVSGMDPARVFVVNGSQQALDLVARLFVAPGDRVLVEAPTYTGAQAVLRAAGARLETVPVDGEGLVVPALEEALRREPARFLYLMPCYQNPTGVSLSEPRRRELLELAQRWRLAVVEDHYTSPLHYRGAPPRPLLADDRHGQVIHLGTFSKILFPGLRLGWMVVPAELDTPLRRLRWATDLSTGTFSQQILDRFCRTGRLERHIERVCQINTRRLDAMLAALEEYFPKGATWTRPLGGMTLWTELPEAVDTLELLREAASRGVLFTPGVAFFPNGGGRNAMRLSFNRESESRIRKGVRLLGEIVKTRLRAGRSGRRPARDAVPFV
jgi:2-aminoadipate transaminase